jgi:hypothetical protein
MVSLPKLMQWGLSLALLAILPIACGQATPTTAPTVAPLTPAVPPTAIPATVTSVPLVQPTIAFTSQAGGPGMSVSLSGWILYPMRRL